MPIATPAMRHSSRGVSMTRSSPNSSRKPIVTLKTPPRAPTSSPSTTIRSSRLISSRSVSWRVCTKVFSVTSALRGAVGVDVTFGALGLGKGRLLCDADALGDLRFGSFAQLGYPSFVEDVDGPKVTLEHRDGILLPPLLDFLTRPVGAVVVVRRVGVEAIGAQLDERRPLSRPSAVRRLFRELEGLQDVVAVALRSGHVVAPGASIDAPRDLLGLVHADRVLVVLTHEDDGKLVNPGEVQGTVPVPFRGPALTEPRADDRVLALVPLRIGDARGVKDLSCDGRGAGNDVTPPRPPVSRHLTPARRRVVGLAKHAQEDIGR